MRVFEEVRGEPGAHGLRAAQVLAQHVVPVAGGPAERLLRAEPHLEQELRRQLHRRHRHLLLLRTLTVTYIMKPNQLVVLSICGTEKVYNRNWLGTQGQHSAKRV